MALDFSAYMDVPTDSVEAPLPLPAGHYYATITSWKTIETDYKNGEGPIPQVRLGFKVTAPGDDVDPDALPKGGVVGKLADRDYNLKDGTGHYAIRTLAETSLDLPTKGQHFRDTLDALKGQEVIIYGEVRMGKEGTASEGKSFFDVKKVFGPGHQV